MNTKQNRFREKDKTIKEEIALYRRKVNNSIAFADFWRSNENVLSKMSSKVREICCIPATSVASEATFSVANYIQRKERSSLSSRQLRCSLLLRDMDTIDSIVVT